MDWYRLPEEGWAGGVCAGLADRFGWDLFWTRVFMTIVIAEAAIVYLALWLIIPAKENL